MGKGNVPIGKMRGSGRLKRMIMTGLLLFNLNYYLPRPVQEELSGKVQTSELTELMKDPFGEVHVEDTPILSEDGQVLLNQVDLFFSGNPTLTADVITDRFGKLSSDDQRYFHRRFISVLHDLHEKGRHYTVAVKSLVYLSKNIDYLTDDEITQVYRITIHEFGLLAEEAESRGRTDDAEYYRRIQRELLNLIRWEGR